MSAGPAAADIFRLTPGAQGELAAQGPLTFASARHARQLGRHALGAAPDGRLTIDCAGVTAADSAGLAVLLDWLATARARGRPLSLVHLPEGLTALARISEVEELLTRGV